ncbi:uroporphyrinogen-III synthase [Brevibacillus sp. TJ4]|uniref:uroporphyrinogen-III synthase n=1 Tax=Brevibacillus sp. TJ4 TaxID=3234853 RepID=UPI003B9E0133
MSSAQAGASVSGPLTGKRLMVTRSRSQAREMIEKIEALGGEAFAFPLIKMVPVQDTRHLDRAIRALPDFDWVIFTSVNGVRFFWERIRQLGFGREAFTGRLAAVGPKTAAELQTLGLEVEVIPSDYVAEGLFDSLQDHLRPGQRVLLPRADIARKHLPEQLRERGLEVTEVDVYHTVIDAEQAPLAAERLRRGEIDAILFTSSSTVAHFVEALTPVADAGWKECVTFACIGPVTARTAEKLGLPVHVVASEYTTDGLLDALTNYWGGMKDGKNL